MLGRDIDLVGYLFYLNFYMLCCGIQFLSTALLHLLQSNCWFQIIGDVTKEDTLDPKLFKGVRKVVNAVSVIVGPKEGDTPDRQKYKQVCHMPNTL